MTSIDVIKQALLCTSCVGAGLLVAALFLMGLTLNDDEVVLALIGIVLIVASAFIRLGIYIANL
jgi:hypothetical protein